MQKPCVFGSIHTRLPAEPVWPNMTMFDAIDEVFTGNTSAALTRLQWYASRSGAGYMPPGEAVAWPTSQPVLSTMSEPLTASSFVMAALTYTGAYDPRVQATNANAGAYDTINETTNPSADWSQWTNVPYYTFPKAVSQSGSGMTDLREVYISNDANNNNTVWTDVVDLSAGTVDALVTSMVIGSADALTQTGRQGTVNASFTMGAGTVTVTGALVAVFPARSAATAFTICGPGAAPAAFQSTL